MRRRPDKSGNSLFLAAVPNPSIGTTAIYYDFGTGEGGKSIVVYDLYGRQVNKAMVDKTAGSYNWNAAAQATGLYIIVLERDGNAIRYIRFVKN